MSPEEIARQPSKARRALRAVTAVSIVAASAAAQQFQFMNYAPRAPESAITVNAPVRGGLAIGDVDADGTADVVVSDGVAMGTLRGNPTGGFASEPFGALIAGSQPFLRDLDGDGDLDLLLMAPIGPTTLRLLLRTPTAWQQVALPTPYITDAQGADVGDIDGDGDLDIVVAPDVSLNLPLVLLRNGGAGTFTAETDFGQSSLPVGMRPRLGDVDGDGDLDLVTVVPGAGVALLMNVAGRFVNATGALPPMRTGCVFHCVADLDGDHAADIATVGSGGEIDIVWGSRAAMLSQPTVAVVPSARVVVAADFDGDGQRGLAIERRTEGVDLLRLGSGRTFTHESPVTSSCDAFAVGDLDGDGAADLLAQLAGNPLLYEIMPHGAHLPLDAACAEDLRWPTPATTTRTHAAWADFDRDGRIDCLQPGTIGSSSCLVWYHSLGDGRFTHTVQQLRVPPFFDAPLIVDLDNDGLLDVAADAYGATVVLWQQNGQFQLSTFGVQSPRLGDVDGDGDLDLVGTDYTGIVLVRNAGGGTWQSPTNLVAGARRPLALGDLDGDGDLDLVTTVDTGGGSNLVLANDGQGGFSPHPSVNFPLGADAYEAVFADLDDDGDPDLAVAGNDVHVLRNDGNSTFVDLLVSPSNTLRSRLRIADFDDDGDLDMFTLGGFGQKRLLLNDGNLQFHDAAPTRIDSTLSMSLLYGGDPVDFDGDGDLDLLGQVRSSDVMINHLRQLRSPAAPRLGRPAQFDIYSGPGFSPTGAAVLAFATARVAAPLTIPGVAGKLQLDPSLMQIVASVPIDSVGVASAFTAVPADATLFGLEVWLQAAILPSTGAPGLTNCVREVVMR